MGHLLVGVSGDDVELANDVDKMNIYCLHEDGTWERFQTKEGVEQDRLLAYRGYYEANAPAAARTRGDGLPDAYKTLFQIGDDKGSVTGENITYDDLGFEGIESKASTTGIQPVIQTIDTDGTSRYFDLQGRQLMEKPAKGFYIKDGKKYLNK